MALPCLSLAGYGIDLDRVSIGNHRLNWTRGIPLLRTALHSSSDLWSGYDILSEDDADDPKKELKKDGIEGMDFGKLARWIGVRARCGSCCSRRVAWESV